MKPHATPLPSTPRPARPLVALLLGLALAACALVPRAATPQPVAASPSQPVRTLSGVVADAADSTPLEGANVFLLETLEGGLSDALGRFTLRTRWLGPGTLVVRRLGYHQRRLALASTGGDSLLVLLQVAHIPMAPVEVEASRVAGPIEPEVSINALDVVTTPGSAADVFRAFQTYPGIQSVDEGAGLFVRGGDASETRVLLNDAVVLSPYRYESPTGGFAGAFDPFALEGITFSTGGFGVRYGDALSAVADLTTLGRPDHSGGAATASLAALSGTAALALPHSLGVRASGTRSNTRLMFDVNGTSADFDRVPEGGDLAGTGSWNYRPTGEVLLFGMDQWTRLGVGVDEPAFSGTLDSHERHGFSALRWRETFGPVAPTASLSAAATSRAIDFGALHLLIRERLDQAHARLAAHLAKDLSATLGGELERRRSEFLGTFPEHVYDPAPDARRVVVESDLTGWRSAAFAEADARLGPSLRATLGLRADRSTLAQAMTWDPRAAVALRLPNGASLTCAWGIYHQVPDPSFYEPALGDPRLPPMRSEHCVAGARVEGRSWLARLEVYWKSYRDLALRTRDGAARGGGSGANRGADLFLSWKGWDGFDARVSYSYLHARRTDPDVGVIARSPFDITHTATVVATRNLADRWSLGTTYRLASGQPLTPVTGATFDADHSVWAPIYAAPMSDRLPSFQRLDLSLSRLQPLGHRAMAVLFLGVANALDRKNLYGYRYSADYSQRIPVRSQFERSVYFGASVSF